MTSRFSLGFDFSATSVRAAVVNIHNGHIAGQASHNHAHGVITDIPPINGEKLHPDSIFLHPQNWLISLAAAARAALGNISPDQIIGIGIASGGCTILPVRHDGTPLCLLDSFKNIPSAWPKLCKSHSAESETQRMNQIAHERNEPWLARCGGRIGPRSFFPNILETLNHAPRVYDAAEIWLEAGDWLVWQLIDGPFPQCSAKNLVRSISQAGFRAMWNRHDGYPSHEFFAAVHPTLANVVESKMHGSPRAPGERAGMLSQAAADLLGLRPGIPVSAAIIDSHAAIPGAGVAAPSTMVISLGTPCRHLMNSRIERFVPEVNGAVEDGILPGYFGYEIEQADAGDALARIVEMSGLSHQELANRAGNLPSGSGGIRALDYSGDGFAGIMPNTQPEQLYRALIETMAFGLKRIVTALRDAGVPVRRFVAVGWPPLHSPLLMQIYADVLDARVKLPQSDQPIALGAAILGCLAAGHTSLSQTIHAMAGARADLIYRPDLRARKEYESQMNIDEHR